jgi:hypothetical protein
VVVLLLLSRPPIWAQVSSWSRASLTAWGQKLLSLGDEADQGVQPDGGVTQGQQTKDDISCIPV